MKSATLIGYHGHKNLGDDIFRSIILKWMNTSLNVNKCFITAPSNSIEKTLFGITMETIETPIKNISRFLWISIFISSLRSNYVVFSAGSIFTIQPFFLMFLTLRLLKSIKGDSLSIMAVGVSIGPFRSNFDKYWCFKSLSLMDQILLRDEKSKKIIDESSFSINSKVSYDLALCWRKMFPYLEKVRKKDNKIIGLSLTLRGFGECTSTVHSHICDSVITSIESVVNRVSISEIRIFAICSDSVDGDILLSKHFEERLLKLRCKINIVIYDGHNIDDYLNLIYECSVVLASRMHAGIMALTASIPVYQISYAIKISEFYKHCDLSIVYMYKISEVTEQNMEEFFVAGLLLKLSNHYQIQSDRLNELESVMYYDLIKLSNIE